MPQIFQLKKKKMKKKYFLIALSVFVMAFMFSGCYVGRPGYYHQRGHHGYHRY
jgi:hypothetical protein